MSKYRYRYKNGGYVGFEGTSADLKETEDISAEITDDSHITVTTVYADGNVRTLECDSDDAGDDKIILTNMIKYWNGEIMNN